MSETIDINGIMGLLPHRYPFLLVDRITEIGEDRVKGIKNVTINEPCFHGHFPGHPIYPGVLQVEGMAQCAGCHIFRKLPNAGDMVVYFMGFDKVKFRKPVVPGDTLIYDMEILNHTGSRAKIAGKVLVDGAVTCQAEMTAILQPKAAPQAT